MNKGYYLSKRKEDWIVVVATIRILQGQLIKHSLINSRLGKQAGRREREREKEKKKKLIHSLFSLVEKLELNQLSCSACDSQPLSLSLCLSFKRNEMRNGEGERGAQAREKIFDPGICVSEFIGFIYYLTAQILPRSHLPLFVYWGWFRIIWDLVSESLLLN